SFEIWSPSLTNKFTTVPESAPSPRAGSLISIVETRLQFGSPPSPSDQVRMNLFRIDIHFLDRLLDDATFQLTFFRQCVQRSDDRALRVHLEKPTQVFARVASSKSIRPQR